MRVYDLALLPSGMNAGQLAVIHAIQRHQGEPLSAVAEDLVLERTSLYRALAVLEKRRWIRIRGGKDARSKTASLTALGVKALERADPGWAETQTGIVERFGRAEWTVFVGELERLSACATSFAPKAGERE